MANQRDWTRPVKDRELYPGSLIGYRRFYPQILGSREETVATGLLSSIMHQTNRETYSGDTWYEAECNASLTYSASSTVSWPRLRHLASEVPYNECTCGFYVNYQPEATFYKGEANQYSLKAVVEMAGHIVLGTKGYRAQRMRILGIEMLAPGIASEVPGLPEAISKNFKGVDFGKWEELVAEFPKSDYESLLGRPLAPIVEETARCSVCLSPGHVADRLTGHCPYVVTPMGNPSLKLCQVCGVSYLYAHFCGAQQSFSSFAAAPQAGFSNLEAAQQYILNTYGALANPVYAPYSVLAGNPSPGWTPDLRDIRSLRIPYSQIQGSSTMAGNVGISYSRQIDTRAGVTVALKASALINLETPLYKETVAAVQLSDIAWIRCGCSSDHLEANLHRPLCYFQNWMGT